MANEAGAGSNCIVIATLKATGSKGITVQSIMENSEEEHSTPCELKMLIIPMKQYDFETCDREHYKVWNM